MDRTELPDYVSAAGPAALGARLRRLSATLDGDARRLYAEAGVEFEQRWLGLLDLLSSHGPLTVGELATSLGISHPSVSQSRDSLARQGLIDWLADAQDRRRRKLRLTEAGRALVERLGPLWAALDQAAIDLDREAGNVVASLAALEQAPKAFPLRDRVTRLLASDADSRDRDRFGTGRSGSGVATRDIGG